MSESDAGAWRAVKITQRAYDAALAVLEHVSRHGWAAVGSGRKAPASLGSVVEDAMLHHLERAKVFAEQAKGKRR